MKKIIALVLSILCIASLAACGNNTTKQDNNDNGNVQIPSPFTDCDTLDAAAAISGFDMAAPDSIDGYDQRSIQAVKDEMIQVIYENGDDSITIRKAFGMDDCSGDYNQYDETNEVVVGDLSVTFKGTDGKVSVAIWTNNGYAYSISSTTALDKSEASDLITAVSNDSNAGAIGGNPATWGLTNNGDDVQIPNPLADYTTIDEAAAVVGFDMTVPESIDGYSERTITAIANEMLQVSYVNGDNKVLVRKAVGSDDISGNYMVYSEINEVIIADVTVTMKGNDGMVDVATWTNGDYAYAISISGAALSAEAVTALVQSIG